MAGPFRELGRTKRAVEALCVCACVASASVQAVQAVRLFAAATALRDGIGFVLTPREQVWVEQHLAGSRAAVGEPRATDAWAQGLAMDLQRAIAELDGIRGGPSVIAFRSGPREIRELLRIVRMSAGDVQEARGRRVLVGDPRDGSDLPGLRERLHQALLAQGARDTPASIEQVAGIPRTWNGKAPLIRALRHDTAAHVSVQRGDRARPQIIR